MALSVYVYFNSQKTFEAKFKNIDGLPKGAQVTALGVPIGKVIGTKPTKDGIKVIIKITNKSLLFPVPGSQLTITSFRPNQGRILEIVPPSQKLSEDKALIIQEPITTESWLAASLDLLEDLKSFSQEAIKYVSPENFEKVRLAFQNALEALDKTVVNLQKHEEDLAALESNLGEKANQANALLVRLYRSIESLNKVVSSENFKTSLRGDLNDFSKNLGAISANIVTPKFTNDLANFKTQILDHLNQINALLTKADSRINDPELLESIMDFNNHVSNLNAFYEELNKKDIRKIVKEAVKNAREITTKASRGFTRKAPTKQN